MSIRIVEISDEYVNYLKTYFYSTMLDNKEGRRIHSRKYIGIVFEINGFKYFAPLSSPKKSDYNSDGSIRSSSKIVLRMVANVKTSPYLLGTIKLNNMIPVPESEITEYNFNHESDSKYKDLIHNELIWIQRNTTSIQKAAKRIYSIKINEQASISDTNRKFYESILSFQEAEKMCLEYRRPTSSVEN